MADCPVLEHPDVVFETSWFCFGQVDVQVTRGLAYQGVKFPAALQGLFVWPAAEAVAEYVVCRAEMFAGKRVIEVGAGVGLLGLTIAGLKLSPAKVVVTDGSQDAVDLIDYNIRCANERTGMNHGSPEIESRVLIWGRPSIERHLKSSFDIVIGADAVYDEDCDVQGLLETAKELMGNGGQLILGMMHRSDRVITWFEEQVSSSDCAWSKEVFASQKWKDSTMYIYKLQWA